MKKFFVSVFSFFPSPLQSCVLCLVSSVLLVLSHPPFNFWFLAWVALVPLFLSLQGKSLQQAWGIGYLFGCVYFGAMFWWLWYVHPLAPIVLTLYLSCYPAIFSSLYVRFIPGAPMVMRIIMTACFWTVLEFIRARFLTGFGWAALGHTQYQVIPIIQIASITATAGVTFLVAFVNAFVFEGVQAYRQKRFKKDFWIATALTMTLFLFVFGYSFKQFFGIRKPFFINIAVVQPNILQEQKWDTEQWPMIMDRLEDLSRKAASKNAELIVWPETALPSYAWMEPKVLERVYRLAEDIRTPILTGLVTYDKGKYYNSALLIDRDGRPAGQYDKIHLVPFGEFLPLRKTFPFLEKIAPIADFSQGRIKVLPFVDSRLGPLICFEDTVEHVSRRMVDQGAQVLVNITNDAWYGHSKAAFLHLQSAVFEAVENRRPMIRAANTGISAGISDKGRVAFLKGDDGQSIFHQGYKVFTVDLPTDKKTFVTKYGDVFTYICFGCILIFVCYRLKFNDD